LLIKKLGIHKKAFQMEDKTVHIIIMGASEKGEERIFATTNYFHELTNFFPLKFKVCLVGPEMSTKRNAKSVEINPRLSGTFFRGTVSEYLIDLGSKQEISSALPLDQTLFLGYNPGFGSGYAELLESWAKDLVNLFDLGYHVAFTQANDYSDLVGETKVLFTIFEDKVHYAMAAQNNPYRAITHYVAEGKKETSWSCANHSFYVLRGWK
jgi:hypothetical protein